MCKMHFFFIYIFQLDKLAAIDFHPILPLGKNADNTIVADAILGGDHVLDHDLLQRLKTVYEALLKCLCSCLFLLFLALHSNNFIILTTIYRRECAFINKCALGWAMYQFYKG